ncbi:MAG: signal peptidase I [Clostridiales bacterium]|nr:signal peptidase I [Clostridiales bacterium]
MKRLKHNKAYVRALLGTLRALIVVAAIAVLIATLVLPVLQIAGDSMSPTFNDGDIIVLLKSENLKSGDLCSFAWNNRTLVKRIIGVPGDWINIDADGTVYVNDEELDEPYVSEKGLGECDVEFPYQVPDGCYFVLGDHRDTAIDSRSTLIGSVSADQIIGKVLFRVWPISNAGIVK